MELRILPLFVLFALGGCQATQELVKDTEQARTEFTQSATKEIEDTKNKVTAVLPPDLNQRFEEAKKQAPEIAAQVNQSAAIATAVLEGHGIKITDRQWIEQTLKDGNAQIQEVMQPLLTLIGIQVPDARAWVDGLVNQQMETAKGEVRQGWEQVRADIDKAVGSGPATGQ